MDRMLRTVTSLALTDPLDAWLAPLSPRAAVRRAAREKLRDMSSRELYLHVLGATHPSRKDLLGALAGLAEVGRAEDAPIVLRWIEAEDPPIQAEAVRCLGHLDAAAHHDLLAACRTSPYARVRREAVRALRADEARSPCYA